MKKIALFLLLLFAAVQAIPLVVSIIDADKTLIFNVDEEKQSEKGNMVDEKKIKKDYLALLLSPVFESNPQNLVASFDNQLPPIPFLEKSTPPPNRIA